MVGDCLVRGWLLGCGGERSRLHWLRWLEVVESVLSLTTASCNKHQQSPKIFVNYSLSQAVSGEQVCLVIINTEVKHYKALVHQQSVTDQCCQQLMMSTKWFIVGFCSQFTLKLSRKANIEIWYGDDDCKRAFSKHTTSSPHILVSENLDDWNQ